MKGFAQSLTKLFYVVSLIFLYGCATNNISLTLVVILSMIRYAMLKLEF